MLRYTSISNSNSNNSYTGISNSIPYYSTTTFTGHMQLGFHAFHYISHAILFLSTLLTYFGSFVTSTLFLTLVHNNIAL